jgi:hypothetical protein
MSTSQARKATRDASDGGAVNVRDACEVKNQPRLALLNERGNLLFEARAVSAMDAARHLQHLHTALKLSMCDLDGSEYSSHFRYSNVTLRSCA